MASVNKVILVGNLGKDPETRYTGGGDAICNITVATSDTWKDKATGERKEATEWHRVVFFGKLAEIANEYLKKGSQVYLEGRIKTRKWQGQDGQDRYTTEIHADTMQMLGRKEEGAESSPGGAGPGTATGNQAGGQPRSGAAPASGLGDFEDDIPFAAIGQGLSFHVI